MGFQKIIKLLKLEDQNLSYKRFEQSTKFEAVSKLADLSTVIYWALL